MTVPVRTAPAAARPWPWPWPASRIFLVIALVLFLLAALLAGGVITASGLGWLVPGGLAAAALAFLVP